MDQNTLNELMPCPYCGCLAPEGRNVSPHPSYSLVTVWCPDCHMQGPRTTEYDAAARAWNSLPRALRWTQNPPTKPGKYWFRCKPTKTPTQVVTARVEMPIENWKDAEWAGPILEPKEK